MSTFPSVLTSYPTRVNGQVIDASDVNGVQSGVTQLEAVVGAEGSASVVGTLQYDVRSPASGGGGHVQSANKGGTGQTTYFKGDLLVAQSTSVLSKLSVGSDNQVLVANSSMTTGVTWSSPPGSKVFINPMSTSITGSSSKSILSLSIVGSSLGTSNMIRSTSYVNLENIYHTSMLITARYAGANISSVLVDGYDATTAYTSMLGKLEVVLVGANSASSQRGFMNINLGISPLQLGLTKYTGSVISIWDTNTASVNSSANQNLDVFVKLSDPGGQHLTVNTTVVERIN